MCFLGGFSLSLALALFLSLLLSLSLSPLSLSLARACARARARALSLSLCIYTYVCVCLCVHTILIYTNTTVAGGYIRDRFCHSGHMGFARRRFRPRLSSGLPTWITTPLPGPRCTPPCNESERERERSLLTINRYSD